MNGPLSDIDHASEEFADGILTRVHHQMTDALDRAAQRDIEGASDWRNFQTTGNRYANR
jgi:fructoselysine-6-P-deglycase FrlB-like protein